MEENIRSRFSDPILDELVSRYGADPESTRLLAGFESFIYEIDLNDETFILRIGHSLRRSVDLILGEVEWISYLASGGANVAKAIASLSGKLVEEVADDSGGKFLATTFVKAAGKPPKAIDLTAKFYEDYGQMLGRIHSLSRRYKPANTAWRRPDWDDPVMLDVQAWLGKGNRVVLQKYKRLLAYLETLPKTQDDYGLIHQDAHYGNIFLDEKGSITLFDFDDCCYSWYVNDLAIVLFYAAIGQKDTKSFTEKFMKHFLRGYQNEMDLDPIWLKDIPNFLKLREIDLYAVIHRSFDVENIIDPWVKNYMDGRKQRIEADVPFIDYEFH